MDLVPGDLADVRPGGFADVRIEKLVYGGSGLAHVEGRALLVPFAVPGDRLSVRISGEARGVLRGSIEAILEASPVRRDPECAHFGTCGGCQLQHVRRETQLEAKAEFVRDALRRIGGIRWEAPIAIESGVEYGWRSRVDLHVERRGSGAARVGYFRTGSHELVAVADCPILVDPLRAELRRLSSEPPKVEPRSTPRESRVRMVAGDDGRVASAEERVRGAPAPESVVQTIEGFDYAIAAGTFAQANRSLVGNLVRRALAGARGRLALDLYAGNGLFTLPLSRSFERVHAVESDRDAVRSGRSNARGNGIVNVDWSESSVDAWLASAGRSLRPDFVHLDPPRAGAGRDVVRGVAGLRPRGIAYTSCDPSTLARDLAGFVEEGYAIEAIAALDLFPQSYHVETVAHLAPASPEKAGNAG